MKTVLPKHDRIYGVGVEWSESIEDEILANLDRIACVELIPENFFGGRRQHFLKRLGATGKPVMVHGVELSIGTDEPLKSAHLDEMLRICDSVNAIDVSDHLCMTEAGGVEIGQLTPLPWTIETCDVVCRKIEAVQRRITLPFLIENIANRFIVPGAELSEPEFINTIVRRTGCSLLLDLHNLHANATNFKYDPFEWLSEIDLDRVSAIHLAGGFYDDEGMLVDGHSHPAPERVWALYRHVCLVANPTCVIVERTENAPVYDDVLFEIDKAREIFEGSEIRNENIRAIASGAEARI